MILSRRRFLTLSVVLAGGAVTAVITAQGAKGWLLGLYHRLMSPDLDDAPTGPLNEPVLKSLLVATRALVGVPVQVSHYEDFFRWRAENLRGYKALYQQFAEALDRRARKSVGCDFVDCSREIQQGMVQKVSQVQSTSTRWDRMRVSVLERDWLLFYRYVLRDILVLFSRTDAWTLLGYEDRPGTPRGLDRYTQRPRNA